MRKLILRLLDGSGYRVLEAADPQQALELFGRHKDSIALLITDIVTPGMRGDELARRLVQEKAELKLIFSSGYTEASLAGQLSSAGWVFLQKPLEPAQFLQTVREVLDGRDAKGG